MSTNPTTITAEPGTAYIETVREFDVDPATLYRATTDPELVSKWLGPRELTMEIEHYDIRPGGSYRYVQHAPDGGTYGFRGVVHTARPGEYTVQTFEFEGYPDSVALETARYEDLGNGRTRLVARTIFDSEAARDGAAASGMTSGIEDSYARLAELAAAL
ncbi:Activator of Hsp90 ATPase 1 family protein [Beutenbergia cavernae DSM 12333]|uniref:Activator of Hsp90 ATPase 1 family protein n=1 Tax=Beutenbergia cavernae (strain ATCC BAA-8 / DSM 12333 / CCUG 43141 / JCM 11478 / NBRC 16432 / NCIMB 13614 / HKI 0122) TaxID=471853 RepID=C5C3N6_BEUC1|nr:SRPBCC family protein [Beutenbergia cavernae]ACQ81945.1 Activator of Hsp90 ATPase 1 family protein [Beutenbergia cavernae DSM 12333]